MTLSAFDSSKGGALVAPPAQGTNPLALLRRLRKGWHAYLRSKGVELQGHTKAPEELRPGRWYDREAVDKNGRKGKWVPNPHKVQSQETSLPSEEDDLHRVQSSGQKQPGTQASPGEEVVPRRKPKATPPKADLSPPRQEYRRTKYEDVLQGRTVERYAPLDVPFKLAQDALAGDDLSANAFLDFLDDYQIIDSEQIEVARDAARQFGGPEGATIAACMWLQKVSEHEKDGLQWIRGWKNYSPAKYKHNFYTVWLKQYETKRGTLPEWAQLRSGMISSHINIFGPKTKNPVVVSPDREESYITGKLLELLGCNVTWEQSEESPPELKPGAIKKQITPMWKEDAVGATYLEGTLNPFAIYDRTFYRERAFRDNYRNNVPVTSNSLFRERAVTWTTLIPVSRHLWENYNGSEAFREASEVFGDKWVSCAQVAQFLMQKHPKMQLHEAYSLIRTSTVESIRDSIEDQSTGRVTMVERIPPKNLSPEEKKDFWDYYYTRGYSDTPDGPSNFDHDAITRPVPGYNVMHGHLWQNGDPYMMCFRQRTAKFDRRRPTGD